jgi:hypothetical protein
LFTVKPRPVIEAGVAAQQPADADADALWFNPPGEANRSRRAFIRERVVAEALTVGLGCAGGPALPWHCE